MKTKVNINKNHNSNKGNVDFNNESNSDDKHDNEDKPKGTKIMETTQPLKWLSKNKQKAMRQY